MYGLFSMVSAAILSVTAAACGYESCTEHEPDKLNVHLVPHTHNDVGWLWTANQYYEFEVEGILGYVVRKLWEDPKRRFVYVESFFFFKWWNEQNEDNRDKVRTLVAEGRLQFAGGAWSMNDEAATSYQSIIDQFTYGLNLLNETFGHCGIPRVAWQIDPFGHSREFASLVAAMGFDGLFVNRIHYQEKAYMKENKALEVIWRGDDTLGKSSDIFTAALFDGYIAPEDFCFDGRSCYSKMIKLEKNDKDMDTQVTLPCKSSDIFMAALFDGYISPEDFCFDGRSCYSELITLEKNDKDMDKQLSKFIEYVTQAASYVKTNNVLIPMGRDFSYTSGSKWFPTIEKLIKYTNLKSEKNNLKIKLFYSTPQCYLKAVHDANKTFPTKKNDYFPYATDEYSYWTGFYTSRPTLKYFERAANTFLQMVKQMHVFGNLDKNLRLLNQLKSAMGIVQHHDAITGTAQQQVTDDYVMILNSAIEDAHDILRDAFTTFMFGCLKYTPDFYPSFTSCRLNESSCSVSETSKQFMVSIYNPLAWSIKEPIRIPVMDGNYDVYAPDGTIVVSQLVAISKAVLDIPTRVSQATHEIVFIAELLPLGMKNYYIRFVKETSEKSSEPKKTNKSNEKVGTSFQNDVIWKTEKLKLNFHSKTGEFIATHLPDGPSTQLKINYGYYFADAGNEDNYGPSGAYKFKPANNTPENIAIQINVESSGPIVTEIYLRTDKNIASTVRLYHSCNFIENDWVVGPINISDNNGKEYVVNYVTSINNHKKFYTDSNGRQLMKRKLKEIKVKRALWQLSDQSNETVASDYYPVTNQIAIQDVNIPNKLSVITDRSEGASSLKDGHIELMLHRRLLYDDGYGLAEALNETVLNETIGLVVRGRHRLVFGKPDNEYKIAEIEIVKQFNLQPQVFVSTVEDVDLSDWLTFKNSLSFANEIPQGLHLLTIEPWGDKLLIRLENYLEVSDSKNTTMKIDLNTIFTAITIKSYKETTLAANRFIEDLYRLSWRYKAFTNTDPHDLARPNVDNNLEVEIKPKQIRTFVVDYEVKEVCKLLI